MKQQFRKGDRVISNEYGKGTVTVDDDGGNYPVLVEWDDAHISITDWYTAEGNYFYSSPADDPKNIRLDIREPRSSNTTFKVGDEVVALTDEKSIVSGAYYWRKNWRGNVKRINSDGGIRVDFSRNADHHQDGIWGVNAEDIKLFEEKPEKVKYLLQFSDGGSCYHILSKYPEPNYDEGYPEDKVTITFEDPSEILDALQAGHTIIPVTVELKDVLAEKTYYFEAKD